MSKIAQSAKTKGRPDNVDIYVGQKIREARLSCNVSQEQLACAVDVTFQQIQKYEHGTNRVAAGRLASIAYALNYDIAWFFPPLYKKKTRKGAR